MQALAHADRARQARTPARPLASVYGRRAGGDARSTGRSERCGRVGAPVTSLAVFLKPSSLMTNSTFASPSGTSPLKGYGMHVRLRLPVPAAGLPASWGQISSAYTRSLCSRPPLTSLHGAQALAEAAASASKVTLPKVFGAR